MSSPPEIDQLPGRPGERFEPYVRLVRCLMPRTTCVAMFGPAGDLAWSSEATLGPDLDLTSLVDEALLAGRSNPDSAGQVQVLPGSVPVYLCSLRDETRRLLAILAIVCRPPDRRDTRPQDFSLAYALLSPVLECLRRELVSRATIEELTHTVGGLDKDLNLLLAQTSPDSSGVAPDDASELQALLQQTVEHLRARTGALHVPERGVTLVRSGSAAPPDAQFLMRAHRRLLAMAQSQHTPVISNDTRSAENPEAFPYRVLCCALRSRAGRFIGLLVLLREAGAEPFTLRDAHIAEILGRKALGVIESSYDALSGLYTRPAFEQRVRGVVTGGESSQAWSALYVDVDQLHAINENAGMHVGDAVLAQLGELLRHRLPPGAFGSRISGDRFVVMLPAEVHDAENFAESLRAGAEQLAMTNAHAHGVSISVGVALFDGGVDELAHVLAAAETACKAAKDRGRNRVEVYQQSDLSIVRRYADIGVAGQLREAIDAGRLHLDAQLILPLAAAETARPHYELLLRMTDEAGRTMGPDSFLSAATRYQLMPVIDRWVVGHVIDALKPRAGVLEGRALGFTINFSGQSLNDEAFADVLIEQVESSGLDPALFVFELTENATVANLVRAEALMRRLRALGCGVALDDFGTGLSSLSCLRQLPVTMLKIDGSFVREVLTDARAESMVRAIAQLARGMSIITVAEYIETEAIGARIAELGVDYGQGFAIGRPIPLAEVLLELPLPSEPATGPADTHGGREARHSRLVG